MTESSPPQRLPSTATRFPLPVGATPRGARKGPHGRARSATLVFVIVGAAAGACTRGEAARGGAEGAASSDASSALALAASAPSSSGSGAQREAKAAGPAGSASAKGPEDAAAMWREALDAATGPMPRRPIAHTAIDLPYPDCASSLAKSAARAKLGEARKKAIEEAEASFAERQQNLDAAWLPKLPGWERRHASRARELADGVFLGETKGAAHLERLGAVGEVVARLARADGDADRRFREANGPIGRDPFDCGVTKVVRSPARAGSWVGEGVPIDWVACSLGNAMVVLEVPTTRREATVDVAGDRATVRALEAMPDIADPAVRTAFDRAAGGDKGALDRLRLQVTGFSWVVGSRPPTAAYETLQRRGAPSEIIEAARRSGLWGVSFEHACGARGLGCDPSDGRAPASLRVAPPRAPSPPTPDRPPEPDTRGKWEEAVLAVDPEVERHPSVSAWHDGFWSARPENVLQPSWLSNPGVRVAVYKLEDPKPKLVGAWRDEIAKQGGIEPFTCKVRDIGPRARDTVPAFGAALLAMGKARSEPNDYIDIVCKGDEKSFTGTIVIMVPTHAAWGSFEPVVTRPLERSSVREYHLEPLGFFEPSLREKLIDVARDTVLRVSAAPRLFRYSFNAFGIDRKLSGVVWVVDLGGFQCAHEGFGCQLFDGAKLPVISAEQLETCGASTYEWRSTPEPPTPDLAVEGIAPVAPAAPIKTRTREVDGAEQVLVEGGPFFYGSIDASAPPRVVDLASFWVDRFEVTTGQYLACHRAGRCKMPVAYKYCTLAQSNPKLPVNCLSREQASDYCAWAGGTLPTDAQWEKAALGTDGRPFPWGWAPAGCPLASARDGSSIKRMGCRTGGVEPVGSHPEGASPWGALDMLGGLWEWVSNAYDTERDAPIEGNDDDPGKPGILRGGSFGSHRLIDPYKRTVLMAPLHTEGTGFRCVNPG